MASVRKRRRMKNVVEYEMMMLKNIKHGYGYSSCDYYPEGDEEHLGYIKVSTDTGEVIEHTESTANCYKPHYSHYAKREILILRAEHDHRREHVFTWIKYPDSDF